MSRVPAMALLAAVGACGPGPCPDGAPCAGPDQGVIPAPEAPRIPWLHDGVPTIAPPDIPWLEGDPPPDWGCPDGWRTVTQRGVTTCDPYPEAGALACPDGEAHFLGEQGCAPIGRACGEGAFADVSDLEPSALWFVDETAAVGGVGSAGAPFRRLADGLDAAGSGDTVVLGRGIYRVDRVWPDGVSLRGRCVRDTQLTSSEGTPTSAVLDIRHHSSAIRIEDVTVGPAEVGGVHLHNAGEEVLLEGLRVREVTGEPRAAVQAELGAALRAHSLVIQDTRSSAGGEFGRGLDVRAGAGVDLRRAVLERNREGGVSVLDPGSEARLEDLVVRDTMPRESDDMFGRGLGVQFGPRVVLRRALLERNRDVGIFVGGGGADALIEDVVICDTLAEASDGTGGRGLNVVLGARVTLRRGLVERNLETGVAVDVDGTGTLEDLVVRDTLSRESDGQHGDGLFVGGGAQVTLRRGLLGRNRLHGALVSGAGTEGHFESLVVRHTLPQARDGRGGRGVGVQDGARVELRRGLLERNREVSAFIGGEGAGAFLEDVAIRDTLPEESDQSSGRGLGVELGGRVELYRGLLERNHDVGVFVSSPGADAVLEDIVIRGTLPHRADGAEGLGMRVELGAQVEIKRALVEGNHSLGVTASAGALDAEDVIIRETLAAACLPECDGEPAGVNLGSYDSAAVELRRFVLADAELCAVQIARDGEVRLATGVVRGHPIGVCLDEPDYPLQLLRQDVRYEGNETLVDSRSLPIPQPGESTDIIEP
ncbi:MAG: hypothetical protein ACFCGT_11865 [Sandaracinaceae bacterium]